MMTRAQETAAYDAAQRAKRDAADKARRQAQAAQPAEWWIERVMRQGQPAVRVVVSNGYRQHHEALATLGFRGVADIRNTDDLIAADATTLDAVRAALVSAGIAARRMSLVASRRGRFSGARIPT